jgi:hypothetical protein
VDPAKGIEKMRPRLAFEYGAHVAHLREHERQDLGDRRRGAAARR